MDRAVHICRVGGSRTGGKVCCSRSTGKLKDRWIDVVIRDAGKLLETAGWKKMVSDRKMWGRKIEEAKAQSWAVML